MLQMKLLYIYIYLGNKMVSFSLEKCDDKTSESSLSQSIQNDVEHFPYYCDNSQIIFCVIYMPTSLKVFQVTTHLLVPQIFLQFI